MPYDSSPASCSAAARTSCALCPAGQDCLAGSLSAADRARWEDAQRQRVSLPHAGQALFTAGEDATAVFIVRAGCIKAYSMDEDGNERVRGFFFPGDIVGLEALGTSHYPASALAVAPSQVCRVSKGQLQSLMTASPVLAQRLVERISANLRLSLSLAGNYSAEQRLAAFLLQMQQRLAGDPARQPATQNILRLPMTRRDIGNYLRLATETVCRVLTRFESHGWVAARDKALAIHKPGALWQLAAPVGIARPQNRLAA